MFLRVGWQASGSTYSRSTPVVTGTEEDLLVLQLNVSDATHRTAMTHVRHLLLVFISQRNMSDELKRIIDHEDPRLTDLHQPMRDAGIVADTDEMGLPIAGQLIKPLTPTDFDLKHAMKTPLIPGVQLPGSLDYNLELQSS
jgi:hypothetical protein